MAKAAKKVHYLSGNENMNIMAAYQLRIAENQNLLEEIHRLSDKLDDAKAELEKAKEEARKYREMYDALRQGHYLLVPK